MTEAQLCGILGLLPLLLPLASLRWPGHAAAPMLALWALANAIFCAPLALLLALGWVAPGNPLVGYGCVAYGICAMGMAVGIGAVEVGAARTALPRARLATLCEALARVTDAQAATASGGIQLVRGIAFFSFGILFSGSRSFSTIDSDLPGWFAVAIALSDLVGYALFAWSVQRLLRPDGARGWRRALCLLLGTIEFTYALMSGRRWAMMLGLLGLLIWWHLRRPSPLRVALVGLLCIGLTPLLFLLFVSLRLGNWESKLSDDPQSAVDVDRMLVITRERLADGSAMAALEENLKDRPYGLFAFAGEVDTRSERPLLGTALLNSLVWATPGNLVDKRNLPMSEELIQGHIGVPAFDTASSWPAYAIADFGLAGGALYGLLFALLLLLPLSLLPGVREGPLHALVAVTCFFAVFQVEQDPATTFALLRNLAAALLVVAGSRWALGHLRRPAVAAPS